MARPFKVKSIHKQMYPGINFRDEANGTSGTDIDFVDFISGGATVIIVASKDGHKKVIKMNVAIDFHNIVNNFDSTQTSGTYEIWINPQQTTEYIQLVLMDAVNEVVKVRFDPTGWIEASGVNQVVYSADTWYHFRIEFDCTPDTYDLWIDGVSYGNHAFQNVSAGITRLAISCTEPSEHYIDAVGYSFDTDYNIGDNVFWRHYKDQDSDFESEDVGTSGADIDFIDVAIIPANCTVTIEPFFSEHKKVLDLFDNNGGDRPEARNDFASPQTFGTVELWVRTDDATDESTFLIFGSSGIILAVQITSDKFQYFDNTGWHDIGLTALDNTWYHLKIEFDSTSGGYQGIGEDNWHIYIDNIHYGDFSFASAQATANYINFFTEDGHSGYHFYIDAISYSWNNDIGDNRTFDYNEPYTRVDITTDVKNVLYKNEIYKWREATLISEIKYENSEVFFQVYDINNKLAMEAEIKNRTQISKDFSYPLRDKNQDDLENRSNNNFSGDKIHDPTDATSILKVILPNVSETEGDLLLVDADTKTDTYSPTTQNYPDYMMLRDISDLADSVVIVHADGKCYLDDDKASGTALDLDTEADKDKMTAPPIVNDILETINFFEIFGAMNPDTGERFKKIIDNTGDDKKRPWRYTNNAFLTQTDVDNYAASLVNRTATIKIIKFTAQSLGAHNMGETIDYKFVDALYNIPQGNYYVIFEQIDFDANESVIILSEGMIEESKYAATYELPENYNDSYAAEIFETDIITTDLNLAPAFGATEGSGHGIETIKDQGAVIYFYLPPNVDDDRDLIIDFIFRNGLHGARTTDGNFTLAKFDVDGSFTAVLIENFIDFDAVFSEDNGYYHIAYTLEAVDLEGDHTYQIQWLNSETDNGNATICYVTSVQIQYFIKRSV